MGICSIHKPPTPTLQKNQYERFSLIVKQQNTILLLFSRHNVSTKTESDTTPIRYG